MKKYFDKAKDFVIYFVKKNSEGDTTLASAYLAYFLLLSFIPLLMFIAQVIVYVVPNFDTFLFDMISNLPNDVQKLLNPIASNIINSSSSSLSVVALFSALWLGSRGFLGLKTSLNRIFEVETKTKFPFFDIIFSVIYTVAFIVILALLLTFSVFNDQIISILKGFTDNLQFLDSATGVLLDGIGKATPIVLSILLFIFFYRYSPSFNRRNRITLLESLLGAVVATFGIGIVTFFYRFTNDTLNRSPSIYGPLGSILVTLVWLLAICQMIIYGAMVIKTYLDVIKKKEKKEIAH